MARMIPPVMNASVSSDGERKLFIQFKSAPGTENWVVLHSLDIARHRSQVSGEIDFVIIIPELGVLCLEVKACRSLDIRDGRWRYGSQRMWDSRGPFKQASEAMHSMRNYIVGTAPGLSNVVFWSAVASLM